MGKGQNPCPSATRKRKQRRAKARRNKPGWCHWSCLVLDESTSRRLGARLPLHSKQIGGSALVLGEPDERDAPKGDEQRPAVLRFARLLVGKDAGKRSRPSGWDWLLARWW